MNLKKKVGIGLACLLLLGCFFSLRKKQDPFLGKIIICGVCEDIETALPFTIASIEEIGSHFADYWVFICENNSLDSTPQLLKEWGTKNTHVHLLSEELIPTAAARGRPISYAKW